MGIAENTKDLDVKVCGIRQLPSDGTFEISVIVVDERKEFTWREVLQSKHLTDHEYYLWAKSRRADAKVSIENVSWGGGHRAQRFIDWG